MMLNHRILRLQQTSQLITRTVVTCLPQNIACPHTHNLANKNNNFLQPKYSQQWLTTMHRFQSDQNVPDKKPPETKTLAQKLKQAVAEYGTTVIVFHVTISLISLGGCYMLVSSGLDITSLIAPLLSDETAGKIAGNAGTFAIAYGVHKVFAPVRIAITLTATPFIVRYLRRIGFLKVKK